MPIRVAIVEDEELMRTGLQASLNDFDEVVCHAVFPDAESFKNKFKHLDIDVVLMDIELPGLSGIECVAVLKPTRPQVDFMMCTSFTDYDKIYSALRLGATGYILKNTTPENLVQAIIKLKEGDRPMSPEIARRVFEAFVTESENEKQVNSLSDREKEVLVLFSKGYTYLQVAHHLTLSINTIRSYAKSIYEKLHVRNKIEAINKLNSITGKKA